MGTKYKAILELSVAERLLLVEEIWESILSENPSEAIALSDPQKQELTRRLNLYKKGHTRTYSWSEVKSSLKS